LTAIAHYPFKLYLSKVLRNILLNWLTVIVLLSNLINLCAVVLTYPWHVHCWDKHYSVWLCISCLSLLWSLVASFFKAVTTPRFLWKRGWCHQDKKGSSS